MFIKNIAPIIGMCALDEEFAEKYYKLVKDKISFSQLQDVQLPYREINTNAIIFRLFYLVNREVFKYIKKHIQALDRISKEKEEKIISICNQRLEDFYPEINCIASHFQNEIDATEVEGKEIKDIAKDVFALLLQDL